MWKKINGISICIRICALFSVKKDKIERHQNLIFQIHHILHNRHIIILSKTKRCKSLLCQHKDISLIF